MPGFLFGILFCFTCHFVISFVFRCQDSALGAAAWFQLGCCLVPAGLLLCIVARILPWVLLPGGLLLCIVARILPWWAAALHRCQDSALAAAAWWPGGLLPCIVARILPWWPLPGSWWAAALHRCQDSTRWPAAWFQLGCCSASLPGFCPGWP